MTLSSQAYGASNFALVGQWLQLTLVVVTVFAVPVMVLCWYSSDVLGAVFGLDPELHGLVRTFSRWTMLRVLPQLWTMSIRQFCMAQKLVKPLVVIAMSASLLNIGLNQLFIHGAFGVAGFGFKGSPMATASTNSFTLVVTATYVFWWRKETAKCWPGWSAANVFNLPRLAEFMRQSAPLTLATVLEDFSVQVRM